jgi:hypothetical protein
MDLSIITKQEVVTLLTQDEYYRKQKEWPLLNSSEFFDVGNRKLRSCSNDLFHVTGVQGYSAPQPNLYKIVNDINAIFPFTNELLEEFRGCLVACGGSIAKLVTRSDFYDFKQCDIDFFFYDLDIHQANRKRIEIIQFMIKTWKSHVGKEVFRLGYERPNDWEFTMRKRTIQDVKFYIQRNEYVTTLNVEELCVNHNDNHPVVHMYQFVHRIYPNISSIIGGFDLSSCMVAYDGREVYATPLGAWSIQNKSIIVDTGRRSTSFEHRLTKYLKYGFGLIIPGITHQTIKTELIDEYKKQSFAGFKEKLEEFANNYGYHFKDNVDSDGLLAQLFKDDSNYDDDNNDELAIYKMQQTKNILPFLILNNNISTNNIYCKQGKGNSYEYWNYNNYGEIPAKCDDETYYLNKISDYGNDEQFLLSISDYSHNHMYYKHIPNANATRLRLDNLTGVVSMVYIDNHENIEEKLLNDVSNPNLGINEFTVQYYANQVERVIENFRSAMMHYVHNPQPSLIKTFGEYTRNIIIDKENPTEFRDIMITKIHDNAEFCMKNLTGIKWITENPGRQWTASINPIFKDPRDWYGNHYNPVLVGVPPEIETCLRLMRLNKTESLWCVDKLPQDLFDKILFHILEAYANDAWLYLEYL